MKRIISLLSVLCILFSLCACKRKTEQPSGSTGDLNNGTNETTASGQTQFASELIAVSVPTVTENTTANDGTVLCQYTYQNMSLVLHKPQVADKIILDFLNRVDSTKAVAESTAELAKNSYTGGSNWVPFLYHITYSPTRLDNSVLSFFGNNVVFGGAGHPERTCVSASYDLSTGDVLTLASIMHKDATVDEFCQLVLDGLKEMAEGDYLFDEYEKKVRNRFSVDASQDEAWYFTHSGLCFYFAPYEIGPYSSGVVSVEIPYEKLNALIHQDYLPQQRADTIGTPTVVPFENVDMSDFSHSAEIIANKEGRMYMIQADNVLQDVRILQSDSYSSYTVFAAYNLSPDNGIMVQADDSLLKEMKLSYKSGGKTITMPLLN